MSSFPLHLNFVADPFVKRIGAFIRDQLSWPAGSLEKKLLVALSGGPDSTALLAGLLSLRQSSAIEINVLHVNHGLRAQESDQDETFCRDFCAQAEIPFFSRRLSGQVQDESRMRQERYLALAMVAAQCGARFVLTGHTRDDQAETQLFHILRGTGPAGLKGMPVVRALDDNIFLARPLLSCSRQDVLDFLRRADIEVRNDSSNSDLKYARNYIRHSIMPLIEARFPGCGHRLERLRTLISEDEDCFEILLEQAHKRVLKTIDPVESWSLQSFRNEASSLKRRLVAKALQSRGVELTFERSQKILDIAAQGQGAVSLNRHWEARVENSTLNWIYIEEPTISAEKLSSCEQALQVPGMTICLPLRCAVHISEFDAAEPVEFPGAGAWQALVDLNNAAGTLNLRQRRPGDLIRPFGMTELVRLKKFLHTHKPSIKTSVFPSIVIADEQEVLWVPGIGLSNKIRTLGLPTHRLRFMQLTDDYIEPA